MPSSPAEYIQHHLIHWQWSPTGDVSGFWTFNLDTIFISMVCGLFFIGLFYYAAKKASVKNPSRLQIAIENVVLLIDSTTTDIVGKRDNAVCAFGLTTFVWIWVMNFMDMLPVDLIPVIASKLGVHYFRAVPTADLSMTLALALTVLLFLNFESIREHGIKGFLWEILSHPFGIYGFPANILFKITEDITRPIALSVRLFANMYAGELVFFLIALAPLQYQFIAGWFWLALHVLIITLQAFIFMVLTIVYVGMAKNSH